MNRIALILLLIISSLGFAKTAAAANAKTSDPCSCVPSASDHLIPVNFDFELEYRALLAQKLFASSADYGRAVIMPSAASEGESCVAVYLRGNTSGTNETRIAYSKADRNIWYAQSESNPNRSHEGPINVQHVDLPFPQSAALEIAKVWRQMLCRTRPSVTTGKERVIVDVTTVELSLINKEGEAWYGSLPQSRGSSTNALYELARLLIAYCNSEPSKRPSVADQIERSARELSMNLP